METEDLTKSQLYKKQFFSKEDKFFSKRVKFIYPDLQDTTSILSKIASKPNFSQIRLRYKTKIFLGKFLLKSHLHWILYAFYRKDTLYIATANHIGQNEINLQKLTILKYCKKSSDFNFIERISIFRDEKFLEDIKKDINIDKNRYIFKERSYGIFENNLKDEKLIKIINNIKEDIIKLI